MQFALFKSLAYRPFALIWSGQTISRLGDSLYRIALAWWVLEKTGSAAIMGTVLIFSFTPMLIFSLIGGVYVDRLPRLWIMITSDLLRGLAVGLIALLAFTQLLEIWHIYALSILFGLVDAFFQPAYTALVPEIAAREILPSANSLTSVSGQFASIVGPALGGILVGAGGTPIAFALDGVSFIVSAVCLAPLLKIPLPSHSGKGKVQIGKEIVDGVKAILGFPWLWITITIAALSNVTMSGPLSVALPFLVKDKLNQDASTLGLISSAFSVGSVLAAIWLGRYHRLRHRGLIAYLAWLVGGLMVMTYGLLPLGGILLAALVMGMTIVAFSLVWINSLQEMVPGEMLGRVSSIDNLGSFVLLPVGYALAGLLTDKVGPSWVFIGGGVITSLLAAVGLLHPGIRKLD